MPLCDLAERRLCATSASSERSAAPAGARGEVGRGIEAVERLGPDAAGRRHGEDLARQRDVQLPVARASRARRRSTRW